MIIQINLLDANINIRFDSEWSRGFVLSGGLRFGKDENFNIFEQVW